MQQTGVLVLGHGSRKKEVGTTFQNFVRGIAQQVPEVPVLPAFFSLGRPTFEEQVRHLVQQGCTHLIIMPYFLYDGVHTTKDIPEMLANFQKEYPGLTCSLQKTLQDDPVMERLVVDRLRQGLLQV